MKGNTMKRTGIMFIGTILLIILAGCGYQLIGGKGIYGGDISSIYVSVFKNSTYEPAISQPVTDSFSKELLLTGLFTLTKESADGYLRGEITDIVTQPSSLGADGVVMKRLCRVTPLYFPVPEERETGEELYAFRF